MAEKKTVFIVAKGGGYTKMLVEKLELSDKDDEFIENEDGEFETFEKYVNAKINEACDEHEQHFAYAFPLEYDEIIQINSFLVESKITR